MSFEDIVSIFLPLIGVTGIIVGAYFFTRWFAKKYSGVNCGKHIKIAERVPLGKDSSLVLVEISSKMYLLSVSPQKTEILVDFDKDDFPSDGQPDKKTEFSSVLDSFMKRGKLFNNKNNKSQQDDKGDKN